jgi:hypothetical protein
VSKPARLNSHRLGQARGAGNGRPSARSMASERNSFALSCSMRLCHEFWRSGPTGFMWLNCSKIVTNFAP